MHGLVVIFWLAGCLAYEPDTVFVTGRLEQHTYPGPPNYESIAKGDAAETGLYLRPGQPICAEGAPSVKLVQLVLDSSGYATLRPRLGKQVTLRGTLSHSVTGHHHARLLLTVDRPGLPLVCRDCDPLPPPPLYVINGRVMGEKVMDIDPKDVDTIVVLHSREAIARFGRAGGNGAILITLKKH